MSISDKIRSIVLSGAFLFSGLTGALYAQDTFPGGVGEKGLQQSSENYQKEQEAKAKKAKEDEERRTKKAEQANNQPKGGFEKDYSNPDDKEDEDDAEEGENDKSLDCKISSFALIDSYKHDVYDKFGPGDVVLNAAANSTDITAILSGQLYFSEFSKIAFELEEGYFSRGVTFSKNGTRIDQGHYEESLSFLKLLIGTSIGQKEDAKDTFADAKENKRNKDAFCFGAYVDVGYTDYHNSPFYKKDDWPDMGGGLVFLLKSNNFQFEVETALALNNIAMKGDYENEYRFGAAVNARSYLPIVLNEDVFMFLKPKIGYKETSVSVEFEFPRIDRLPGYFREINFALETGFVFNLNDAAYLALGPELKFHMSRLMREHEHPADDGFINDRLDADGGVCATLVWDWFKASLSAGYDYKTFDFFGGGEPVKKQGPYVAFSVSLR